MTKENNEPKEVRISEKPKTPVKIGLTGSGDTLKRLGIESEKVIDRIYLDIIEKLSSKEHIRKFTVVADYNELKNIMSIEVLNKLYVEKYCSNKKYKKLCYDLLEAYQEYLIANNDGRGRRDYVTLFTGSASSESPSFNIRKMLIDKLQNKKGLGETM